MKLIPCSISKYKSSLNSGNGLPETQSKLIMHLLSSQSFLIIKQVYIYCNKRNLNFNLCTHTISTHECSIYYSFSTGLISPSSIPMTE